ncbi:30S ribosomal protein S6 [Desulfogranum mediterraneum]|uniref:30S ribosomal protein S6 n=1 Tax=Desulfogranum mediterraneum TaxID=160661 RepID=UPI000402A47F|nr:30S ribosomal protein S6 [Desulfogranum mediterraneum]
MRHYETTYILRPNLGEEQFTEIIERTNNLITNSGGVVLTLDRWGMKKLAYEIKKEVQGYYVYVNYAAPGEIIREMDRIFRIDDRLLRFLTIKLNDSMDAEAIAKEQERLAAAEVAEEEGSEEGAEEAAETTEAAPAGEETKSAAADTAAADTAAAE